MMPTFDERDARILEERLAEWNRITGPRVGDYVRVLDGSLRRFTHEWPDGLQTTCGPRSPCDGDQSFYHGGSHVSYSGSLDPTVAREKIVDTGEVLDGSFWFFHHNYQTAHNGVHFKVACRVFQVKE